jgi:hypothetical protein
MESTTSEPRPIVRGEIPSIKILVRHSTDWPYAGDGTWPRCTCKKRLRWSEKGRHYRVSAPTRSWEIAEDVRRKLEAQFQKGASGTPSSSRRSARRSTMASSCSSRTRKHMECLRQ